MEHKIYSKTDPQQLKQVLECLYSCLELPVRFLDENGNFVLGCGVSAPFCECFKQLISNYAASKDSCSELHAQASRHALKSGKPYVFYCHVCLTHLIFPLNAGNEKYGSVLIGPFLNTPLDADAIADIAHRYKFSAKDLLKLYNAASTVKIITPEKTEQISLLMSYLFSPLLSREQFSSPALPSRSAVQDSASCRKPGSDAIENAIHYIRHHYDQPLTLKGTAAYVDLNPSYFSTLFKQRCGMSFKDYLNAVRIEKSKKLLQDTDYPILDIALAVGFEDQSYFTKVFKKYTQTTPRQYRL